MVIRSTHMYIAYIETSMDVECAESSACTLVKWLMKGAPKLCHNLVAIVKIKASSGRVGASLEVQSMSAAEDPCFLEPDCQKSFRLVQGQSSTKADPKVSSF